MKKTVLAFIAFLLSFSLTSCVFLENQTPHENEKPENLIYDSDSELSIVFGEGVTEDDVMPLWDKIGNASGNYPRILSASSSAAEHEIIVGKCDRAASLEAYRLLDRVQKNSESHLRVLLYSDGASVAIAYDDVGGVGLAEALSVLEEYCVSQSLVMSKGVQYEDSFDKIEKLAEIDAQQREAAWEEYEKALSSLAGDALAAEITEQMKSLYQLYDSRLVIWLADLYDPDICVCDSLYGKKECENHPLCGTAAFYFTPSGRDTCGYLPTVESTASAMGFTAGMGLTGGLSSNKFFPAKEVEKIGAFVYNLQDPDGFFYHPQWGKNISKNRRGRDFSNSLNLMNLIGIKPKYATISDVTDVSYTGVKAPLGRSDASLVSRVVMTETLIPDYLKSTDAFRKYLDSLDINNRSYEAGSEIATIRAEIVARDEATGDPYVEILGEFLDSHQLENGLWRESSDYAAINGLMKISSTYNGIGREIPNVDKAIASAVDAMATSESDKTFVDIWNPWQALVYCLTNVTEHKSDEDAAAVRNGFYELMPEAIRVTKDKLTQYMRDDGSISTFHNMGTATMMGYPCGVPNTKEGDMDASMLGSNQMVNSICTALGVEKYKVKVFGSAEGEQFLDRIKNASPIRKATGDVIVVGDTLTFDDCTIDALPDTVVFNKDEIDRELVSGQNGGLALKVMGKRSFESVKFACENATMAAATCYVFEADFSILSTGGGSEGLRVDIGEGGDASAVYRLLIRGEGGKVSVWDTSSVYKDYAVQNDLGIRTELGEWFNLRVEFYNMGKDNTRIKIYFNGELCAVSDNFYTAKRDAETATPFTTYNSALICSDSQNDPFYIIDNVRCYKSKDAYSPAQIKNSYGFDVDKMPSDEKVYSFDELEAGELYPELTLSGDTTLTQNADGKRLRVGKGGSVRLLPTKRSEEASAIALSFDISSDIASGDLVTLSLLEGNYTRAPLVSYTVYVKSVDGVATAFLRTGAGEEVFGVSFAAKEKNNIKIEYFPTEKMTVFYVNGEKAGVSSYSSVVNPIMKFGVAEVSAFTTLSLDNLVCETNGKSLTKALEPEEDAIVYGEDADLSLLERSGGAEVTEENGDRVLSISGKGAVCLPINRRDKLTNAVRLEFSVRVDEARRGTVCEIFIEDENKTPKVAFALICDSEGIALVESTLLGNHIARMLELSEDKEAKVTLEYFEKEGRCNIYLDGEYVFVSTLVYTDYTDGDAASALIRCTSDSASVTFDALRLESYGGYAAMGTPVYENPERGDDGFSFENSSGVCLPSAMSSLIKSSGSLTVSEVERDGEFGKALVLKTASDGFDKISVASTASSGSISVFEADFLIGKDNLGSLYELNFLSGGTVAYRLTLHANTTVGISDNLAYPGYEGYYAVGSAGEWIKLRVEYSTYETEGELLLNVNVSVNGEHVYTSDKPFSTPVKAEITSVDFCATIAASGSITIDNLKA